MEEKNSGKFRVKWKSFRFRVVAVTFLAVFILLGILIFNNIYAIKIVRQQVFEANYRVLRLYMNNVDHAFEEMEDYFVGLQSNSNLITAGSTSEEIAFYTAQARLQKEMGAYVISNSYIEDLFVYFEGRDQYMDASHYEIDGSERAAVRRMMLQMIQEEVYTQENAGKWVWGWIGEEAYLVRILRTRSTYMGGCVKVSTLVERLRADGFGEMECLSFCTDTGEDLGNQLPQLNEMIQLKTDQEYYRMVGKRDSYMMLSVLSGCGDYGLVALIRDNNILEGLKSFQLLIWLLLAILAVFLVAYIAAMRRWVILPLDKLIHGMHCLSRGEFGIRLSKKADCEEFSIVNKAFDDMTEQIETLKIGVYEEKIRRQRAELQYMKLQVNPHFYINCLNIIHNLSLMKQNDLIQQMTTYLGNHLRYTMEGSAVDTLNREIACVENYLKIQQLRFPDSIVCEMEVEDSVRQVQAPPLLIQTFVENTVKYQVVAGDITHIYIRLVRSPENYHRILIEIWDDGEGYPEKVLDCLVNDRKIFDERGEHYGIRNVRQRLRLIYHENVAIDFSNHPLTGGAYVRILLPDDIVEHSELP
ncbi:MAG: histidine kinase [Candidatus Limivivens sp.]|nr:histidine kinase [Candidatus Limivivens sp.]